VLVTVKAAHSMVMYSAFAELRRDAEPGDSRLPPEVVVDIVWGSAQPSDGLQHVRVSGTCECGHLDVILLLHAQEGETALLVAASLLGRVSAVSGQLTGWSFSKLSAAPL
jgi:hypothetical protein